MSGRINGRASSSQEEASKKRVTRQQAAATSTPNKNLSPNSTTSNSKTGPDHQVPGKSKKKKVVYSKEEEEACEGEYVSQFVLAEMVDDMAREQSKICQSHLEHTVLLRQLEEQMEQLLSSDTDQSSKQGIIDLLLAASQVGDSGVKAAARIRDITDDKLFNLDLAAKNLDKMQLSKSHQATSDDSQDCLNQEAPKRPARISIMNSFNSSRGKGKGKGTPKKKSSQEANDSDVTSKGTPAKGQGTPARGPTPAPASPVPSCSSSTSSKPKSSQHLSLDSTFDDTGYRTCKYRNTANYAGTCTRLPIPAIKKKRRKRSASVRRSARNENSDMDSNEDDDGSSSEDDNGYKSPVPLYCLCEEASYGKMVECDNDMCPLEWFHFKCVGLKKAPNTGTPWFCPNCREEGNSKVKKPSDVLSKELLEYNKKKQESAAK